MRLNVALPGRSLVLTASELELDAIREGIDNLLALNSDLDTHLPPDPHESVLRDLLAELERVRVDFRPAVHDASQGEG